MRIGQGYDIHIFQHDRPLILGGIKIREHMGLLGHSDADVLIHALMDAILGAMGLNDIGYYFPNTDSKYKDIDSRELLKIVIGMMEKEGYQIVNVDSTIVCEKPKLKDYIPLMKRELSSVMNVDCKQIGIKATTNERQDSVGRGKSIEAFAICLLEEKK